jgi:hypothetical protein
VEADVRPRLAFQLDQPSPWRPFIMIIMCMVG